MYNLGLTKLGYSNVQKRYSERCAFIITWTICRGCTESVGKFPRPWTGTVSPRIESKRCTCSQDNTQNRRHCSDTSPEDMSMERTTSFKKGKNFCSTPAQISLSFQTDEAPTQNRLWKAQLFHSCSRYQLSAIYLSRRFVRLSSCVSDSLFPIHAQARVAVNNAVMLETHYPNGLYTY